MNLSSPSSASIRRFVLIVCCFSGLLGALIFNEYADARLNENPARGSTLKRVVSFFSSPYIAPVPSLCSSTGLIISEFRLRGATGPNDEFIELYNNTDQPITICTTDGSTGWAVVSSDGVVRFVVPVGTVIPPRAHYLAVGSGYSLSNYAAGDLTYSMVIPDNLGLALFNTAYTLNFTQEYRLDAAGFTTDTNTLYREGTGFSPVGSVNNDFSLVRKLNGAIPQDTGNNASDFVLVATNAGTYGSVVAVLGSPGPENLTSPIQRNAHLSMPLLDPTVGINVAPNRTRETNAVGPNAALGTLTIRRKVVNNSAAPITRLRFRIIDITTLNSPGYVPGGSQADLRALSSTDSTVNLANGTPVPVKGTFAETPPAQPNGGGVNASFGMFGISMAQPLAPGASINVQFVLGVQQGGTYRHWLNCEVIANSPPVVDAGGPYAGVSGSLVQFNGSASYDSNGSITSSHWNFGDGSTAQGLTPSHLYSSPGNYNVTLTVTDNEGSSSTATTTANIASSANQRPVANPGGPYSATVGTPVQFNGLGSYDPDGSIVAHSWSFAEGQPATGATPTYTFSSKGIHLVTLTVTDNAGAKSWSSINVNVASAGGGEELVVSGDVVDWNPTNRGSLDDPTNHRGNLPNKTEGNNNFQIVAPVVSLSGRGADLNLNLIYNSLVWNKSGSEMAYDIDNDWPAAGWQLGFGKMVGMGTAGALLIEPDGTRHGFSGTAFTDSYTHNNLPVNRLTFKGKTTDGSLIEYRMEGLDGTGQPFGVARYPNGMVVRYTNFSTDFSTPHNYLYPYSINDANGNVISIKYIWDLREPRLERIIDSLGRVISFHYDSQKRLTAVTAPGLPDAGGSPTVVTLVRLHYSTQTVVTNGAFSNLSARIRNTSPTVIDAIYYPATSSGYWFGSGSYSSYGMLTKVIEQRGMSFVPGASFVDQGTITQGVVFKQQVYDYPMSPAGLTSAPTFTNVTESWDGGVSPALTTFVVQHNSGVNERTVTTTRPDGTKTIQKSFNFNNPPDSDPNKFKDGLVKEIQAVDANGVVIQKTVFTWEQGADKSPRLTRTDVTDENNKVLVTEYDMFGDNNSVGRVRERNYNGFIVITTRNTFVSYTDNQIDQRISPQVGINVIHPRLINLVESVKIYTGDDSANVVAAHTITKYDEYSEPLKSYTPDYLNGFDLFTFGEPRQSGGITGILQHAAAFNPMPFNNINGGGSGQDYVTRRGNVTSVTSYANTSNPANPASPITQTRTYDMAGNVINVSTACCEQTSSVFDLATQYGFTVSQTRGSSDSNSLLRVTTSATYDLKTGLQLSSTDANGRQTSIKYDPASLRPKEIVLATGAVTTFDYDDAGLKVTQTTRLTLNGSIASKTVKHFNGLGQLKKEEALAGNAAGTEVWDIVETLYDQAARPWKQSRPYRSGDTPKFRETVYDAAGRVREQREPYIDAQDLAANGTVTAYFYNEPTRPAGASNEPGQTTRVVDPWERWKWARLDLKGRLAEVVEPNPAGGNGLNTKYFYDSLGNLIRVEQGVQVRRFRYDSVGRLTHQKMAEAEAKLNNSGERATTELQSERWSDVFTYDARSNLISRTDARGVRTNFSFKDINGNDDPLNRLQSVSYDLTRVDTANLTVLPAATVSYQYRVKTAPSSPVDVTQIKQVVAAGVSTEDFEYDTEGRIREQRLTFNGKPGPMTTSYQYDSLGRLALTTYPQQYLPGVTTPVRKAVTPAYDVASRTTGLKVNAIDYASQITYNAASQVTSLLVGTGTTQSNEIYDYSPSSGLLFRQRVVRGASSLQDLSYGYAKFVCWDVLDAMCLEAPRTAAYTGQLKSANTRLFQYDSLGRLSSVVNQNKKANWSQSYSYDDYGNRTATTSSGTLGGQPVPLDGAASLSYDTTSNRITTPGFAYDAAGNQTATNGGQQFIYDAAGRLTKVKNASGATLVTYTYGSSNRRLITQTGAEGSTAKTYYVWQGDSVITEYTEPTSTAMPQWSKNYLYLGSRLLATEQPNGSGGELVQYHHPDRLGTRLVTNNADVGSFIQSGLPFGTALDAESTGTTNRRFTSYDRSSTTGLDYAVNRTYDPRQGRFTQPDPIGMSAVNLSDPQSLNMYSYVGNDPVNRVDPDGQFWGALFRFFAGFFSSMRPNIVTGSFTFGNRPPISVSFTPNFQNIGVAFGGIGVQLRMGGLWLHEVLQQKKSIYRPVTEKDIHVLTLPDDPFNSIAQEVVAAIVDMANRQACSDAFKKYGLVIPYDSATYGHFRITGVYTLRNHPNAGELLGWTSDQVSVARETFRKRWWEGLIGHRNIGEGVFHGIPSIVFNPYADFKSLGGLREVVAHALIHVGGMAGDSGEPDLQSFKGYKEIIEACK